MRSFRAGERVTVLEDGEPLDGIVVHAASLVRVEVAVPDPGRGPVFRGVHPKVLRERADDGPHDDALRDAIRRTAPAGSGSGPRGRGAGRGRPGHGQASGHRTTGK
jgi:hypothetical protein